jgi:hypothetical protein
MDDIFVTSAEDLLAFHLVQPENVRGSEIDEEIHDPVTLLSGLRKCSTFHEARVYAVVTKPHPPHRRASIDKLKAHIKTKGHDVGVET